MVSEGAKAVPFDISSSLTALQTNSVEVVKSLEFLHEKFDSQAATIKALEAKLEFALQEVDYLKNQNDKLAADNSELHDRLNQIEQSALDRSLDIQGLPEVQGETPAASVIKVGRCLGLELRPEDVEFSYRYGKPIEGRRALNVKFLRRADRDEFVRQKKMKRNLVIEDSNIFVNESLTPFNRKIYALARKAKKATQGKFKFLWIRDGKIYARPENGKRFFIIKTEKDIELIK